MLPIRRKLRQNSKPTSNSIQAAHARPRSLLPPLDFEELAEEILEMTCPHCEACDCEIDTCLDEETQIKEITGYLRPKPTT